MKRRIAFGFAILTLLAAGALADTIYLKDGTTLKGKLVSITADSLYVKTSFGPRVAIARASAVSIDFTDGALAPPGMRPASPGVGGPVGEGTIAISFKDRAVSSKIRIPRSSESDELQRANWIVVSLFVDGRELYSAVDTVMDKTIYDGPNRVYKNEIELEDFEVTVPAGVYNCMVVVRNSGADEYADKFEDDPLNMTVQFDNVRIDTGRTTRYRLGIDRGRFRMGNPKFKLEGN